MALVCHRCKTENASDAENCVSCGAMLHNTIEVKALPDDKGSEAVSDNAEFENKLDETAFLPKAESPDEDSQSADATTRHPAIEEENIHHGDDETHATTRMPHMNDDDGLLHIGSVRFRGNLLLTDKDRNTVYRIENEALEEAIVGRLNAKTGFRPEVDFTDGAGKERGVSRRHATINQRGDLIFVTDHNSLNGTYLNGQRLVPEQARVMRDSDTLRIGHITLIVSFERPSDD